MDPQIKQRFTPDHLRQLAAQFNCAPADLRELDGFESFIYEFSRPDGDFILRVSHSQRRSVQLIRGEVDWINHLARHGAGVARAIHSTRGELVEAVEDGHGQQFLATAFVKAKGRLPNREDATPALFEAWGQSVGRLHALTKGYSPSSPDCVRPHWNDPIIYLLTREIPAEEEQIHERARVLEAHIRSLPVDPDSYGLIHQDAHAGNFFIDEEGRITLFDFDDCCYAWFVDDIAIVLFYASMWEPDPPAFARRFLKHFMEGYWRENCLDSVWLREIPTFLKLREIDLYGAILNAYGPDYVNDPWCAGYMKNRRERIINGVPYIDLDFGTI